MKKPTVKLKLKKGKGSKDLPIVKIKKPAQGVETGAELEKGTGPNKAGVHKPIDPKHSKKNNLYKPQKFSLGVEKVQHRALNTNMTDKSNFDKLFEQVMGGPAGIESMGGETSEQEDIDALDIDVTDEGGAEEITITLPRDLAQQLHDALMGQLEGAEDEMSDEELGAEDLGADIDEDEFGSDDEDTAFPESVEVQPEPKALGDKGKQLMGKGNMKVNGSVKPAGGKAESSATVKCEPEPKALGEKGKQLMSKGNMKVNSKLTPGKSMFD